MFILGFSKKYFFSLLLNMNDCTQQSMKVSEARRMEQRSIAQLFSKTKAARQHANNLERCVLLLESQVGN